MGRDKNTRPSLAVTGEMVEGVVKWFDNGKGIGFIAVSGYQDVFIHMTTVRCAGLTGLRQDDKVKFEVACDQNNPTRTLAINLQMVESRSEASSARVKVRVTGTVKWFNNDKGIGFIAQDGDGQPDVFVGDKGVPADSLPLLRDGRKVSFIIQQGSDGRTRAAELQLV